MTGTPSYRFTVCELKTGRVLDDAPLVIEGQLSRILQGHSTGTLALPLNHPECPDNWEQLILPWRTLILVLDDQDRIVWHGIPTTRNRRGETSVEYPCVTIEGYFVRRYVPDLDFRLTDQADIAKALVGLCGDAAGLPFLYDTPQTGVLRDRTYVDGENARVYQRLQELAAVVDGFNWTVDVDWTDETRSRVDYTFRTGYPHLGNRSLNPDHVFELPGNVTSRSFEESWGEGDAATHVRAIGDGDGEIRLMSTPVVDTLREAAGWPRLEERRSFSGVTEWPTLQNHAEKTAAQLFGGQRVLTLTARTTEGTTLGDIRLGDSARITIDTPALQLDEVWTVVAWDVDPSSRIYTPTIAWLGG